MTPNVGQFYFVKINERSLSDPLLCVGFADADRTAVLKNGSGQHAVFAYEEIVGRAPSTMWRSFVAWWEGAA